MIKFDFRKAYKIKTPKGEGYIITDGEGGAIFIPKGDLRGFSIQLLQIIDEEGLE